MVPRVCTKSERSGQYHVRHLDFVHDLGQDFGCRPKALLLFLLGRAAVIDEVQAVQLVRRINSKTLPVAEGTLGPAQE